MKLRGLRARLAVIFATLGIVVGVTTINSSNAFADSYGVHIQHVQAGYCLDSNAGGDVYMNPCQSGNGYQEWNFIWKSELSAYIIQDVATGRCLKYNYDYSSLYTDSSCSGGVTAQGWEWWSGNWGAEFESWDNAECLDGANQSVYVTRGTCIAGNEYQNWYIINI